MRSDAPVSTTTLRGQLQRCSINSATLGHRSPIDRVARRVADAGFGWIAPWRRDLEGVDVPSLRRQLDDDGLRVSSLCRSTFFPHATADARARSIDDNKAALDTAAELRAACYVLVVGGLAEGSRDLDAARDQVIEGIGTLLDHAAKVGVPLALEPLHPMYAADRSCVSTLRQALDICDLLSPHDRRFLGVAIDIYHVWWDPDLFEQIGRAGRDRRILGFHVSDWLRETGDLLLDRGMMGDGVVELNRIRRAVDDAGYDGPIEVEIFSRDTWWTRAEEAVLRACADRLETCC